MSTQEANEALSSLVLDGIFDEASGSIKYILSQVVLKLQEQGKQLKEQDIHIKHLEQHAKDSESKHEQAQPANILEYKSSLFVVRLVIFLLYIRSYNKKCFLGFLQINIMLGVIIKRVQKESH